jgi:hypothetical protein
VGEPLPVVAGELGGEAVRVQSVAFVRLPARAGTGAVRRLAAISKNVNAVDLFCGRAASRTARRGTEPVTRCPQPPQSAMKSQRAATIRTGVHTAAQGNHDQDDSAKEREHGEEEDGAFGDGHQSAAGRSAPGKAPGQDHQGASGTEQKDARDRELRVHQQENARLSERIRTVGR